MLQLTESLTLPARIHQQQRGAAEDRGVQFLLARAVRPDGRDQCASWMSAAKSSGVAGSRGRHDQAVSLRDLGRRGGDPISVPRGRGRRGTLRRAARLRPQIPNGPERQHFGMHAGLQARLNAGSQDADRSVPPAEFARHHRRYGGGPHVGEVSRIGQESDRLSGLGRRKQHHAVAGGQALREVGRESGRDLQGEIPAAPPVAGFHVDLGARRDIEVHRHGRVAFAARIGDQGVAHAVDDARNRRACGGFPPSR